MSEKNINKGIVNFVDEEHGDSIIKVVGVGGGGGNAVNHMFKEGIHKVSFVLCNTDKQALDDSPVPVHLQLGKEGLGAGNRRSCFQRNGHPHRGYRYHSFPF